MVKQALTGGAYTAHSVIASAQRCVNLFPEPMPEGQGEPMPAAHYPTPGLRLLGTIGTGPIRGIRQCTTGGVYVVSGSTVYSVDTSTWAGTSLGSLTPGLKTPVSMQDNGLDMVIVDGTANGWDVTLAGNTMAQISDPGGMFSGADRVDYLDTFFILNKPKTPQFYISGSFATTFDPLDFANKEAYSDLLVTVVVAKRLLYLFGERTTEIWYDAGATDIGAGSFPFAAMQSEVFIDHGCAAKYSPAVYDNSVFWLTRDRQGQGIVMMVAGYQTKRVSTYAIEAEIAGYERINDAIGFTYQLAGHSFYALTFPQADKTWSYDITTGLWHQWAWIDTNGDEHRHRANCFWPVNDTLVVGDWQNGNLYALDNRVFTDNGQPIKRVRAFPHMLNDGKRVFYRQFLADMETGNAPLIPIPAPPAVPAGGFRALPLPVGATDGAAFAVSADGTTAVGYVNPAANSNVVACFWNSADALTIIGTPQTTAYGVSADGSVIVGDGPGNQPFIWTVAGGLVPFAAANDFVWGISADGSRLIGTTPAGGGNVQACFWNRAGVRTNLGFLPGHVTSRPRAVSADGTCIVGDSQGAAGIATLRAFRWTAAGGMVDLGVVGAGAIASRAYGVSDDGALVAGDLEPAGGGNTPFRWTQASGMTVLPIPPGGRTQASCSWVSGDGSTIGGFADYIDPVAGSFGGQYFAYWISGAITVPTPIQLAPADPDLTDIANWTYPTGMSIDGSVAVGYTLGNPTIPWIYRIATPSPVTATTSVNMISLRWSDDRGHSWSNPVPQDIGETGEYRTSLQWQRLGMTRDRCFEISWSVPMKTALQGAWIDVTPAQS